MIIFELLSSPSDATLITILVSRYLELDRYNCFYIVGSQYAIDY